jgi:hypothetical protein
MKSPSGPLEVTADGETGVVLLLGAAFATKADGNTAASTLSNNGTNIQRRTMNFSF